MSPNRVTWRLVGMAALVVVVSAAAASVALARATGTHSTKASTLVDGTTDTVTNLDPAGTYDYGTFTLDANIFEHLLDFKNGAKLEPSLATKCCTGREPEDVALHPAPGCQVPRRHRPSTRPT